MIIILMMIVLVHCAHCRLGRVNCLIILARGVLHLKGSQRFGHYIHLTPVALVGTYALLRLYALQKVRKVLETYDYYT